MRLPPANRFNRFAVRPSDDRRAPALQPSVRISLGQPEQNLPRNHRDFVPVLRSPDPAYEKRGEPNVRRVSVSQKNELD